jgi:hypothetical protein
MLLDDNYDTNKVNWREERVGSQNTVFGMSCETEWYHKHSRLSFTIGPKVPFHRNACKRNTIRESEIPRAVTKSSATDLLTASSTRLSILSYR